MYHISLYTTLKLKKDNFLISKLKGNRDNNNR